MQAVAERLIANNNQVFVGRQPILDRELNTYAYELLFRPGSGNAADFTDGEKATAQVIHNTLMEIGLDELVGPGLAYINFTRDCLISDVAQLLPPDRVVLEVLENIEVDGSLIQGVRALIDAKFTIALDDFEYDPEWESLIRMAKVIKIDVKALGADRVREQLQYLQQHDVKLLAEKVETQEEFEVFRDMGFDYFQGYFFARPKVISREKMPENQIALLNLISRLQDVAIDIEEIEMLVSQNISLSYKLLRYINSAFFALPQKINSIRQVVIYFGLERLKNWASLLAMTDIDEKPSELLQTGLVRARMCTLLAEALGRAGSESYFMLGLFSILDALMDSTMEAVIEQLPITSELSQALLHYEGDLGAVLACCLACENNNWSEVCLEGLDDGVINRLYMESIRWSRQAGAGLSQGDAS